MKQRLKAFFLVALSTILCCQPVFATLPQDDVIDYYDKNGIYYYNPEGSNDACNSSATTLSGSTTAEKIWNFYIQNGFTDAQAAGILGNAMAETTLEPTRSSSGSHWGLYQWSDGRQASLFSKISEAGLSQYTSSEYWPAGASEKIPESDFDKLLQIELEFSISENSFNWQDEIKKQNQPEAAAEVFLTLFERAVGGSDPIKYYSPFIGIKYQATSKRRDYASEYFKEYSGKGTTVSGATSSAEEGANLSIIGDSIAFMSEKEIFDKFPELIKSDFNAISGRTWKEGINTVKSTKLKDTVVFALGTNSADISDNQLLNALVAIGSDKKIVLVTNYDKNDSKKYESNNSKFLEYAKNNSNIIIADWEGTVNKNPDMYLADNIHPNESGKELFAETIYTAINSNTNENGCSVNGEFTSLVKAYAWPEYHAAPYTNRMPDYAEAVTTSISEGRYVGGSINGVPGIDCGGFVTILVQNSGLASDYNDTKGATDTQEAWVKSHNWTLLNGSSSQYVDTSILQAGDVAFSNGHTFIYVGEISGFNSTIASASYGQSSARAPMAGHEDLLYGNGTIVRWYRNPQYSSGSGSNLKTNLQNKTYKEE